MKKILIVLIIGIFIGCKKENQTAIKNNSLEKYYIISFEDKKIKERLDSLKIPPPLIPAGASAESNLIIDKNSNFFYYQRPPAYPTCGTGMQNDTIPKFINLQPKDIVEIPEDCIEKFINKNVMKKEKRKQILIIASQNDTIKNIREFLEYVGRDRSVNNKSVNGDIGFIYTIPPNSKSYVPLLLVLRSASRAPCDAHIFLLHLSEYRQSCWC